ncbi:hypothetical protein HPB48_022724 [Haemaphysalis longicornis]|uniref:Serpin domain-containing protein n=1 Tax=Haemaphysalis longicornis TaxID=44386 RepID=A0A9J6GKJ6_HAELO|nr:hypothetical protein HPB48_022724 [Haemaphysalis longicornis]
MIIQERPFKVGHSNEMKARALELQDKGGKASMFIFRPDDTEGLSFVEKALTSTTLRVLMHHLRDAQK